MSLHAALAAGATLLALAFMLSTLDRYLHGRGRHQLVWTISLGMFALGSLGLWLGAALGWSEWTFKVFYLFGAILNVPFLALGTVYLLGSRRTGDLWTAIVSLAGAFAAGLVVAAPISLPVVVQIAVRVPGFVPPPAIDPAVLPRGSEVFGAGPRIAAAVASGVASVVIVGGALVSAWRLARAHRAANRGDAAPARRGSASVSLGRLAVANVLIALGTLVLGAGGTSNSVLDAMDAFAVSLVVGIAIIFGGFLLTNGPRRLADVAPWYPTLVAPTGTTHVAAADANGPHRADVRPTGTEGGVVQLDDRRPRSAADTAGLEDP